MRLIIGGCAQGKLDYVMRTYGRENCVVFEGEWPGAAFMEGKQVIIRDFHVWVRNRMLENECPEEMLEELLERYQECIIISDEIGNGIVPIDSFEREYRERVGRILIAIAKKAETVERIVCGMSQKIK